MNELEKKYYDDLVSDYEMINKYIRIINYAMRVASRKEIKHTNLAFLYNPDDFESKKYYSSAFGFELQYTDFDEEQMSIIFEQLKYADHNLGFDEQITSLTDIGMLLNNKKVTKSREYQSIPEKTKVGENVFKKFVEDKVLSGTYIHDVITYDSFDMKKHLLLPAKKNRENELFCPEIIYNAGPVRIDLTLPVDDWSYIPLIRSLNEQSYSFDPDLDEYTKKIELLYDLDGARKINRKNDEPTNVLTKKPRTRK